MTLYQLINLSEAASCGSISQAAKHLHISQPALSESIKSLEDEYNIQIFIRSPKGIILTPEGSDFIAHVQTILQDIEGLNHVFSPQKTCTSPTLSISCSKIPFVQKVFMDFYIKHDVSSDKLSFSYFEANSIQVLQNICDETAMIGIIFITNFTDLSWKAEMNTKQIEYHYLCSSFPAVIMRKEHPLSQKKLIRQKDLNNYTVIYTYEPKKETPNNNRAFYTYNLKSLPKTMTVYKQGIAFDLIETSDAVCIMSCPTGIQSVKNSLIAVPYEINTPWNIYWIKKKNHKLSKYEKEFIELLKKNLSLK